MWCSGSAEEYGALCDRMVATGTLHRLDPAKRPNSFLARADPSDVARVEERTVICSEREENAGPTNTRVAPAHRPRPLNGLCEGGAPRRRSSTLIQGKRPPPGLSSARA